MSPSKLVPRFNRRSASVFLSGTTLSISDTFKYIGITFEAGRKIKVSLTSKKIKFLELLTTYMHVLELQRPLSV